MLLAALTAAPFGFFIAWTVILLLISPVLFVIAVMIPEIPLILLRRMCHIPFEAV